MALQSFMSAGISILQQLYETNESHEHSTAQDNAENEEKIESHPDSKRTLMEMLENYEWNDIQVHLESPDGKREIRQELCSSADSHPFPLTLSHFSYPVLPLHKIQLYVPDTAPVDVLLAMIRAHPDSLLVPTRRGYYPIHLAILSRVDHRVIYEMLKLRPEIAQQSCFRGLDNYSPLHMACEANNPWLSLELIQILLEFCPSNVLAQNNSGRLPIHLVCIAKMGSIAVKERFRFPEAFAAVPNENTKLRNIFKLLLKTACILTLNDYQSRELSEAHMWAFCAYQFVPQDLHRILSRFETDAFRHTIDSYGNTPLHMTAMAPFQQTEAPVPRLIMPRCLDPAFEFEDHKSVLGVVLSLAPSAARHYNSKGELPLHVALKIGHKRWYPTRWHDHGIEQLVQANPESATEIDLVECLYPFMLAASIPCLDTTFLLLQKFVMSCNLHELSRPARNGCTQNINRPIKRTKLMYKQ